MMKNKSKQTKNKELKNEMTEKELDTVSGGYRNITYGDGWVEIRTDEETAITIDNKNDIIYQ